MQTAESEPCLGPMAALTVYYGDFLPCSTIFYHSYFLPISFSTTSCLHAFAFSSPLKRPHATIQRWMSRAWTTAGNNYASCWKNHRSQSQVRYFQENSHQWLRFARPLSYLFQRWRSSATGCGSNSMAPHGARQVKLPPQPVFWTAERGRDMLDVLMVGICWMNVMKG